MKKTIILILIFSYINISAGEVLNKLKKTPATQYQVGIFQLELGAFILTQQLKDKQVSGTSFKLSQVSVEETKDSVYLKFSAIGKTKEVTEKKCNLINNHNSKTFNIHKLTKDLYPGLSDNEYDLLKKEVLIKSELISKDNANFSITCE